MTAGTHIAKPIGSNAREAPASLRWAQLALTTGAASSVVEASMLVFTHAGGSGDFKYTADYWLTGVGVSATLASFVLVLAVRRLQNRADGRLGLAGLAVNNVACLLLAAQMTASLISASEVQWGPSYPLATLAAFIGLSLFAAGSWHIGLLSRWMLAAWPITWVIGSMAAQGPTPLLLTAYYITMAFALTRRALTPT